MNLNRLLIATAVTAALTACGSDSDDSTETSSPQVNQAPQANDVTISISGNEPQLIDVLANDADPDGDALTLVSVSSAEYGMTSIQDNQVSYAPEEDFAGTDSFSYVMTDGEFEAEAEVTVSITQPVSLVGRVIDAPIANAMVVIEIQDQRFEVVADEEGRYELPLEISNLDNNEVVRLRARGSVEHNQAFVTLSSRLLTVQQLLDRAGSGGELTRTELNQVQVTQLTTAHDVLLESAANGEPVTSENLNDLDNSIDPELIIEMAAVIKLLVDDETYELPNGMETLEDFLADATSYNETLSRASSNGDLERAIEETLSDPDVMPELRELSGQYIQIIDTPAFMTNRSLRNYDFRDNGLMVFGGGVDETTDERGLFLHVEYNWQRDGNEIRFTNASDEANFYVSMTYFPYDLMNQQQRDALVETHGEEAMGWGFNTTRKDFLDSFRILSQTENSTVVRLRNRSEYPPRYEYDSSGERFELIPKIEVFSEQTIRLAKVDSLKMADGAFTDVTSRPIILPDLYGYTAMRNMYNLRADGSVELAINDYYYHYGSNFHVSTGDWNASWSLHDDDTRLRITLRNAVGEVVNYIDNYKHRESGVAYGLISVYQNDYGERFISLGEAGQVPAAELTPAALTEQLDSTNMLASAVNRSLPDWEGNKLKPSDWFGWSLHNDGTGELPSLLCDGTGMLAYEVCEGEFTRDDWPLEELTWQIEGGSILIDRNVEFVDYYCDPEEFPVYAEGLPCNRRVIMPLSQNQQGVVLGVEYNVSNTSRFIGTDLESKPFYLVEPRFMVWSIQNLPDDHDWNAKSMSQSRSLVPAQISNPLDAYNRVNNSRDQSHVRQ